MLASYEYLKKMQLESLHKKHEVEALSRGPLKAPTVCVKLVVPLASWLLSLLKIRS